ncbi:type II toxin-antitoxin system RelE/ParE family toxin [Pelagibacterium xiamenense]|uniref:type II toxin-antitoxin system RelE/ParE family toxin n=1 Tax=Pelagibacterium xiamenense TaxID=2901140 RepID=UPI001E30AA22|nr:type II toxin-antitoxin system RelE/ParE family toxin [Pelagibacterium xiamenense]MCD7059640.1 type II toxin-antitoxin system RelE/ParE family toxin [Pelagibacterium xiamenense]
MRLVRSDGYRADLAGIADYIANDNAQAALAMWDEIEAQVERLRMFPHSGREGRQEGTRELIISGTPYVVVYAVAEDVTVLRVLHGAQRWPET